MPLIVPVQPVPSQTLRVILDDQFATLTLRQLADGLYMSIAVDQTPILVNVICENLNRIVRNSYLGFDGDFIFYDTSGNPTLSDPDFTGLGTQFILIYLSAADLLE